MSQENNTNSSQDKSETYDASNIQKTAKVAFWAFPGRELLIAGIILVVVIVILARGRKRFGKALKVLFGKNA